MELQNVDEIEFFGFLPVSFTNELQDDLQECLHEIFQNHHLHHKIRSYVIEVFRRNLFIFNNFVLRNILKFPANFKLERKVTDKTIQADIQGLLDALFDKQRVLIQLQREVNLLKRKINIETNRSNGYKSLLQNKTGFNDSCTGAREIKAFLRETNELLEKCQAIGKKKDAEFERLMEYRNIKSEYYKNEREKLLEIADFETLENFNRLL